MWVGYIWLLCWIYIPEKSLAGQCNPDHQIISIETLLISVWRRNPFNTVKVHSDQGSQYTSHYWSAFLKTHGLEVSMSRRGNYHNNAVAESFSSCSNGRGYDVKSIQTGMKPDKMYSITLKCFTAPYGAMVSIISCHL